VSYPEYYGYLAAVCAIVAFGSFNIPLKSERVQRANADPMIFQIYMNIAIFITSWLVLSYNEMSLTVWGILSAVLWIIASLLSIFAIKNAGLAVSQGIWSGFTIIVSFLWGAVVFQQPLKDVGLSVLGLLMLMVGIAGISTAGSDFLDRFKNRNNNSQSSIQIDETLDLNAISLHNPQQNRVFGCICAACLALTNGSMLVPIKYSPPEAAGINFLVSFGIGVIVITPIIAVIYFIALRKVPVWDFQNLLLPGLSAGVIWNIGNWASIYATNILGYTVGFPLAQCALLMAAFWGIILFKEITGTKRIGVFTLSALILLGGAVLLTIFGKK